MSLLKETDILVEVVYNQITYLVPESVLQDADAIMMPDGVLLNLKKTGIEHDFTYVPNRHRLFGTTQEFEFFGTLPTLKVVEVCEIKPQRVN